MPRSQLHRLGFAFVMVVLAGFVRAAVALVTAFTPASHRGSSPTHPTHAHGMTERDVTNLEVDRYESVMGCVEATNGIADRADAWLAAFDDPHRDAVRDVGSVVQLPDVPDARGVDWLRNAPLPWPQIVASVDRLVADRAAVLAAMRALAVYASRASYQALDARELSRLVGELGRRFDVASASEVAFYETLAERRHHMNLRVVEAMRHDVDRIDEAYFLTQLDAAQSVWLLLRPHALVGAPVDRPRLAAAVARFRAVRDDARGSTYGTVLPLEIDRYLDVLDTLVAAPDEEFEHVFSAVAGEADRFSRASTTVRYQI
jgi:hypothetical protein